MANSALLGGILLSLIVCCVLAAERVVSWLRTTAVGHKRQDGIAPIQDSDVNQVNAAIYCSPLKSRPHSGATALCNLCPARPWKTQLQAFSVLRQSTKSDSLGESRTQCTVLAGSRSTLFRLRTHFFRNSTTTPHVQSYTA